jgi:hypothetical protein
MSQNDGGYKIFEVPLSRMETISKGDLRRYPLDMLKVGEAFVVGKDCNRQSLNSCKSKYGKRTGKKFVIRKIDGEACCIRVA